MIKDKIIHQIYFENKNLKLIDIEKENIFENIIEKSNYYYKNNLLSWINLNKKYRYILWNKKMIIELISNKFNNLYNFYIKLDDNNKMNFASYIILYHYGGIFVSNDIKCIRNLDNLIMYFKKYNIILTKISNLNFFEKKYYKYFENINDANDIASNDIIISTKNHSFWMILISNIVNKKNKNLNFQNYTGYLTLTKTYINYKYYNRDIILANHIFLRPCNNNQINCDNNMFSYAEKTYHKISFIKILYYYFFTNIKNITIFILGIMIIVNILYYFMN